MCMEAGMEAERLESPAAVMETPAAVVETAAAAAGMETAASVSQVAVDPVVADDHDRCGKILQIICTQSWFLCSCWSAQKAK